MHILSALFLWHLIVSSIGLSVIEDLVTESSKSNTTDVLFDNAATNSTETDDLFPKVQQIQLGTINGRVTDPMIPQPPNPVANFADPGDKLLEKAVPPTSTNDQKDKDKNKKQETSPYPALATNNPYGYPYPPYSPYGHPGYPIPGYPPAQGYPQTQGYPVPGYPSGPGSYPHYSPYGGSPYGYHNPCGYPYGQMSLNGGNLQQDLDSIYGCGCGRGHSRGQQSVQAGQIALQRGRRSIRRKRYDYYSYPYRTPGYGQLYPAYGGRYQGDYYANQNNYGRDYDSYPQTSSYPRQGYALYSAKSGYNDDPRVNTFSGVVNGWSGASGKVSKVDGGVAEIYGNGRSGQVSFIGPQTAVQNRRKRDNSGRQQRSITGTDVGISSNMIEVLGIYTVGDENDFVFQEPQIFRHKEGVVVHGNTLVGNWQDTAINGPSTVIGRTKEVVSLGSQIVARFSKE